MHHILSHYRHYLLVFVAIGLTLLVIPTAHSQDSFFESIDTQPGIDLLQQGEFEAAEAWFTKGITEESVDQQFGLYGIVLAKISLGDVSTVLPVLRLLTHPDLAEFKTFYTAEVYEELGLLQEAETLYQSLTEAFDFLYYDDVIINLHVINAQSQTTRAELVKSDNSVASLPQNPYLFNLALRRAVFSGLFVIDDLTELASTRTDSASELTFFSLQSLYNRSGIEVETTQVVTSQKYDTLSSYDLEFVSLGISLSATPKSNLPQQSPTTYQLSLQSYDIKLGPDDFTRSVVARVLASYKRPIGSLSWGFSYTDTTELDAIYADFAGSHIAGDLGFSGQLLTIPYQVRFELGKIDQGALISEVKDAAAQTVQLVLPYSRDYNKIEFELRPRLSEWVGFTASVRYTDSTYENYTELSEANVLVSRARNETNLAIAVKLSYSVTPKWAIDFELNRNERDSTRPGSSYLTDSSSISVNYTF